MNMQVQITDQAALGFVTHQRTHIEAEVLKKPFPAIRYAQMIPVDTSADKFAASVTFFTQDAVGKAKFVNTKGDDIPLVNLTGAKFEQTINDGAIGYSFSLTEIGAAMRLGQNLNADGANAANMGFQQLVDEVAFTGNSQLGVEGLYNTTGIDLIAATATFAASSPQVILRIINDAITQIWDESKSIELADTIVLPLTEYAYIATTQISDDNPMTILEFIQKSNIYTVRTKQPLNIEADHRLTGKMVVYRKDPEVLKLHMPMPLEFIAPQLQGINVNVYGMFRFAPVNIRRPGAIRYVTGI